MKREIILLIVVFLCYSNNSYSDSLEVEVHGKYGYIELHRLDLNSYYHMLGVSLKAGYNFRDTWIFHFSLPVMTSLSPNTNYQLVVSNVGIDYILDVARLLPYLGLGISYSFLIDRSGFLDSSAGINLGGGVRYLLAQILNIGVDFRIHYWFFSQDMPLFMEIGVVLNWVKEI